MVQKYDFESGVTGSFSADRPAKSGYEAADGRHAGLRAQRVWV